MTQRAIITKWHGNAFPSESSLQRTLATEGLFPYRWSNGPGDMYSIHSHAYGKVIYVIEGSITFNFPDLNETISLHAGDRLDLPPHIAHNAVIGEQGVVCLEAHQ